MAVVIVIRTALMFLDIYVLYMFCKALFFFMIVKAERFHLLDQNFGKCDSFIVLWALALILIYTLGMIGRALYSPLPLISQDDVGSNLFEDIFKYLIEPTLDFLVGISFLYFFYQLAKSEEEHKNQRAGFESLYDIKLVYEEKVDKEGRPFSINSESDLSKEAKPEKG